MFGRGLLAGIPAFVFVEEVTVTHQNYPQLAMRTEIVPTGDVTIDRRIVMPLFGAFNAALSIGSGFDDLKRAIYYKQEKDPIAIMQKLGDWSYETRQDLVLTPEQSRMLHAAMGLITESVEFLETVVNNIKDGVPFDPVNIMEEGGDLDWYKAIPQNIFGFTIEQRLSANIKKLRKRFPKKFETELAVNRDLAAERKVLEEGMQPPATSA